MLNVVRDHWRRSQHVTKTKCSTKKTKKLIYFHTWHGDDVIADDDKTTSSSNIVKTIFWQRMHRFSCKLAQAINTARAGNNQFKGQEFKGQVKVTRRRTIFEAWHRFRSIPSNRWSHIVLYRKRSFTNSSAQTRKAIQRSRRWCLQICFRSRVTLILDFLTRNKSFRTCHCSVDHSLCNLAAESVLSFSKYCVDKFGHRRTNGWTGREHKLRLAVWPGGGAGIKTVLSSLLIAF